MLAHKRLEPRINLRVRQRLEVRATSRAHSVLTAQRAIDTSGRVVILPERLRVAIVVDECGRRPAPRVAQSASVGDAHLPIGIVPIVWMEKALVEVERPSARVRIHCKVLRHCHVLLRVSPLIWLQLETAPDPNRRREGTCVPPIHGVDRLLLARQAGAIEVANHVCDCADVVARVEAARQLLVHAWPHRFGVCPCALPHLARSAHGLSRKDQLRVAPGCAEAIADRGEKSRGVHLQQLVDVAKQKECIRREALPACEQEAERSEYPARVVEDIVASREAMRIPAQHGHAHASVAKALDEAAQPRRRLLLVGNDEQLSLGWGAVRLLHRRQHSAQLRQRKSRRCGHLVASAQQPVAPEHHGNALAGWNGTCSLL